MILRLRQSFCYVPIILMGPGHSSSLRIGGDSSAVSGLGRTGNASDRSAGVDLQDAPGEPPDSCHSRCYESTKFIPKFLLLS